MRCVWGFLNVRALLRDVRSTNWMHHIGGPFDIIISNPPYIENTVITGLAPEVALFDPYAALAGGEDGLDFYRMITTSLIHILCPDGLVVFEAGAGQADAVRALLHKAGLVTLDTHPDLGGVARAVTGRFEG